MAQTVPKLATEQPSAGEQPIVRSVEGAPAALNELPAEERGAFGALGLDGVEALQGAELVGRVLCNRYLVEEIIQQSAGGVTCRAYHLAFDRAVLVRLVQDRAAANEEAWLTGGAARLKSRFVLNTLESGRLKGGWRFFVAEHPLGSTLSCLESELERLSITNIVALGRQMATAVDTAHRAGLTHGDLKFDDMFLSGSEGRSERLLIVGFGTPHTAIASSPPVNSGIFRLSADGSSEPMPISELGAPADVRALGLVLRELVRVASRDSALPPAPSESSPVAQRAPMQAVRHAVLQGLNLIVDGCLGAQPEREQLRAWEAARDLARLEVVARTLLQDGAGQIKFVVHTPKPARGTSESALPKVIVKTDAN